MKVEMKLPMLANFWPKLTCQIEKVTRVLFVTIILVLLFNWSHAQHIISKTDDGKTTKRINRENIPYFVNIFKPDIPLDRLYRFSPNADLKKYPLFEYRVNVERVVPIKFNSTIPDEIWDLPIRIVNDIRGRDSITLRELAKDKILVLDFWATYCSPCLESMDKWKYMQPKYAKQVQVVGLMTDYDFKAESIINEKGWHMPQLIGPEVYLLNFYFCGTPITGPSAWIKNDKFIGVTETKADKEKIIEALLKDEVGTIPENEQWKLNNWLKKLNNRQN